MSLVPSSGLLSGQPRSGDLCAVNVYLCAMGVLFAIVFAVTALGSAVTALPRLVMEWRRAEDREVLFSVATREPVVALTIDDGPSPAMPEILEVLAENRARGGTTTA